MRGSHTSRPPDALAACLEGATYRGVHVQVLHLLLELVHHRRHLLQVHAAQRSVQGFGHLRHVLGHLAQEGVRRQQD